MTRKAKSQWDFGELFPAQETRSVLTVSELTGRVRQTLERGIGSVWVSGEITNFRAQSSGHLYFTLKDAAAQLACVLFRGATGIRREFLADGQKVLLQGEITVYEARGQYQLLVKQVELQGIGALQLAFERLKQKLAAEGLFESARKRPLPAYPFRVGVVTSPTGAALRDVLHVIERRHPALQLVLAPCRVQGQGAAEEIAAAIRLLNGFPAAARRPPASPLDLILVTRGGGSLEDLWAFNEEVVARAIFESALPVVSAVGHEIDFTISDFVADFRAATPSAAAEILTQNAVAAREFLALAPQQLRQRMRWRLESLAEALATRTTRLLRMHPRRKLQDWMQRLDDLQEALLRSTRRQARDRRASWEHGVARLWRLRPTRQLQQRKEAVARAGQRARSLVRQRLDVRQARFENLQARLKLLGPQQVLARGYSITLDAATGAILRSAKNVKPGQQLKTRLKHGAVLSRAEGGAGEAG
jgi:exodeoxyribonuclease VII large subunit